MDLLKAVERGNISLIRSLIQNGADVNKTLNNKDLIFYAIQHQNVDTTRLLIEAGADLNKKYKNQSVLIFAIDFEVIDEDNLNMISLLIEAGVNVNEQDHDGTSPLMFAISKDHIDIVRLLIHAGADPNAIDNEGQDIFSYYESDDQELYNYLLTLKNNLNGKPLKIIDTPDPMVITSRNYSDACGICLEPIVGRGCSVNCTNHHIFHCDCIGQWISTQKVSLNTTDSDDIIDYVRNPRTGEMEPMYASQEILSSKYNDTCPLCRAKITEMYYVDIPEGFTTGFGKRGKRGKRGKHGKRVNSEIKYLISLK